MSIQLARLARAATVIGAGLLVLACFHVLESEPGRRAPGAPPLSAAAVVDAVWRDDAQSVVLPGEGITAADAPPWFAEEVFSLEGLADLRANDAWSVVGFSFAGTPAEALSWCRGRLEEGGWVLMESGLEGSLSAVKEGGRVSWLLFSSTAVAGRTCVVIQAPAAS